MWTVRFWRDATERMVKSAAQGALLYLGGDQVLGAWHANWAAAGGIALGAAILSLLTSLVSSRVGDPSSASLVDRQMSMTTLEKGRKMALDPTWRKSKASSINGACVEVRRQGDVQVRDTKDRSGPVLTFSAREWGSFIVGVKAGEFDL